MRAERCPSDLSRTAELPPGAPCSYVEPVHSGSGAAARNDNGTRSARDLVIASNFIRAVRESGYVNLSTALAELIDNSLQAGATSIAISIARPVSDATPEIRVEDNGSGMSRAQLQACLQFGGTARFDDRRSFGRFGMGLPAASLSQARRVEVAAWRAGGRPLEVSIDVDEIAAGSPTTFRTRGSKLETHNPSGCIVVWRRCDRIEYQRLAWLERALHRDLGRMYRRFLGRGLALTVNGSPVRTVDPLLLDSKIEGRSAVLAFDPLRYELSTADGGTAFVQVRFTALPVEAWHHLDNLTKRRAGIVGGGGVSILRAGREIAFGWHLMGGKRKENYDDWWRCEVEFEPPLDENFGITINKQGIRPSAGLREALEPELESIARLLNARVRQAFEEVKFRAATQSSCRVAEAAEPHLPVLASGRQRKSAGGLAYRLTSGQLPTDQMFSVDLQKQTLQVTLNVDHPAFAALYRPLQGLGDESGGGALRTAIELLVLSFARTSALLGTNGQGPEELVSMWSDTYGRMLQKS